MKYNILFNLNDAYASKLCVALSSLLDYNQDILETLNIMIRTPDLSERKRVALMDICTRYGLKDTQIHVVYADKLSKELETYNLKKFKGNYLTYYKVFGMNSTHLPIDDQNEKLLVVDCDTIIYSIREIFEFDLQGRCVGAVQEGQRDISRHYVDDKEIVEYNCGVLLYDLKRWNDFKCEKRLLEEIKNIKDEEWTTGDQTVFSMAMQRKQYLKKIPLKFNFIINQTYFTYEEFCKIRAISGETDWYSKSDYEDAKQNPNIVHLISGVFVLSPWFYESKCKYKPIFDKYIRESNWESVEDVYIHNDMRTRMISTGVKILEFLPWKMRMAIFRKLCGN